MLGCGKADKWMGLVPWSWSMLREWKGVGKTEDWITGEYQGSDGEIKQGKWRGNSLSESYLSEGRLRSSLGDEFSGLFEPDGEFLKGHLQRANGDLYVGSFPCR